MGWDNKLKKAGLWDFEVLLTKLFLLHHSSNTKIVLCQWPFGESCHCHCIARGEKQQNTNLIVEMSNSACTNALWDADIQLRTYRDKICGLLSKRLGTLGFFSVPVCSMTIRRSNGTSSMMLLLQFLCSPL